MGRLREMTAGSPSRLFLSTRGLTSTLALVLALYYTKLLGVEKRSILIFIMVSALILTVVLTSGLSLTLRNRAPETIKSSDLLAYLYVITLGGALVAILNTLLLSFYSGIRSPIPISIYIICFIYSFFACVNLGFQDALVAKGNLKLATFFDFITVTVQGLSILFFVYLDQTSLFMSIAISFVISYLLITFATLSVFIQTEKINFQGISRNSIDLIKLSKQNQLFGISNGLVDRIDRFLIGLMLPLAILAKYALITSIISFTRFFPDAYNRVRLMKHHQAGMPRRKNFSLLGFILVGSGLLIFVLCAQIFVQVFFGEEWALPGNIALLFAAQEILRGVYQTRSTQLIALGDSQAVSRSSLILIVAAIVLMLLGLNFIGLIGAPLAMVITYLILIRFIGGKLKASV